MIEDSHNEPALQRHFGLLQATALNVTMIVGAGVFVTIPLMLKELPGPYAVLGWLAAGSGRHERAALLLGGADHFWGLAGGRLIATSPMWRLHHEAVTRTTDRGRDGVQAVDEPEARGHRSTIRGRKIGGKTGKRTGDSAFRPSA